MNSPAGSRPQSGGTALLQCWGKQPISALACARSAVFCLSQTRPVVAHLQLWEAKIKAEKKSRRRQSQSPNQCPRLDAKALRQPRQSKTGPTCRNARRRRWRVAPSVEGVSVQCARQGQAGLRDHCRAVSRDGHHSSASGSLWTADGDPCMVKRELFHEAHSGHGR